MIEPEKQSTPRSSFTQGSWPLKAAGAFVLGCVVAAYVTALRHGNWPPSHPWSGIPLVSLGLVNLGVSMRAPDSGAARMQFVAAGLAVLAAALWLSSALAGA